MKKYFLLLTALIIAAAFAADGSFAGEKKKKQQKKKRTRTAVAAAAAGSRGQAGRSGSATSPRPSGKVVTSSPPDCQNLTGASRKECETLGRQKDKNKQSRTSGTSTQVDGKATPINDERKSFPKGY